MDSYFFLVSVGSVDKIFVNCLHLFSSVLRFQAIYRFLFLFCTRSYVSTSPYLFQSLFVPDILARLALSPCLCTSPTSHLFFLHPKNTFLFFFPIRISCISFYSFFSFCSFSCCIYFFFLVKILRMHIPYYLHLCSLPNYGKARCSHTFLSGT